MTYSRIALLLVASLNSGALFLVGCGEEVGPAENDPMSSGGDGTGGEIVSGAGGAPLDDFMSDAFSLQESGGAYTLEHGELTMIVAPGQGGRIVSFAVSGIETLVQEGDAAEYGSTFWPSPR